MNTDRNYSKARVSLATIHSPDNDLSRIYSFGTGTNETQRREERREKKDGNGSHASHLWVNDVQVAEIGLPLHCNSRDCSQAARKSLAGPQESIKTGRLKTGKWDLMHFPVFNFPVSPGLGCGSAALRSSRLCGLLGHSLTACLRLRQASESLICGPQDLCPSVSICGFPPCKHALL
jgi:hypothetical protein